MAQIWIVTSRADAAFAGRLTGLLRAALPDHTVSASPTPTGAFSAEAWREVVRAIEQCAAVIWVLSNEGVRSPVCQAQIAEAWRVGRSIFLVQARDETAFDRTMCLIPHFDLRPGSDERAALSALITSLHEPLRRMSRWGARRMTPLWRPAVDCPEAEAVTGRAADSPDVTTPICRPPLEVKLRHRSPLRDRLRGVWDTVVLFVIVMGALVVGLVVLLRAVEWIVGLFAA